jgi:hypothetical protein
MGQAKLTKIKSILNNYKFHGKRRVSQGAGQQWKGYDWFNRAKKQYKLEGARVRQCGGELGASNGMG